MDCSIFSSIIHNVLQLNRRRFLSSQEGNSNKATQFDEIGINHSVFIYTRDHKRTTDKKNSFFHLCKAYSSSY